MTFPNSKDGSAAAHRHETLPPPQATTGAELLAFLRASPLRDADFEVERDRSPGRPVDLE